MTDERFEQILSEMRDENVPAEESAATRERVWRKLGALRTELCGEFQPEFSAYLSGGLAESRRLLLEDHLGRCPDCRTAFAALQNQAQNPPKVVAMPAARPRPSGMWKWAIAAGVAVMALYLGRGRIDTALAPSGPGATVQSVAGSLYRVSSGPLAAGAAIGQGEAIRTGPGTRVMLRLADGSEVEMNERTELSLTAAWSGQSIHLARGDVIVQAAPQRSGRLRVLTRDAAASVKGTVFAVSSASAGSMVSVVEGAVQVSQPGGEKLLHRGEQTATNPALDRVGMRQAVSWSQNADRWALLGEFAAIEKQLAALPEPALRTQARLLASVPEGTQVYVAVPNIGETLRQALTLIDQRSQESAVLRTWWTSEEGTDFKRFLERLQTVTPLLGEEIVVVFHRPPGATSGVPLLLAAVKPGQKSGLEQALAGLAPGQETQHAFRVSDTLLMVSDSAAHLAAAQSAGSASSDFASEISRRYQRGVGWLIAVDLAGMKPQASGQVEQVAGVMGRSAMKHLFFEQRSFEGSGENEAAISFAGARSGIASWLAGPGPTGSAEYVSRDAVFALSASTRNPRQALDDLLASGGIRLRESLARIEAETGVRIGEDLAASLGTDFTVAVEKPTLPIPEWLAVAEVLNPGGFDATVRRLVEAANRHASPDRPELQTTITQEVAEGRAWTSIRSGASPAGVVWTHDRGYLVAGGDRAHVLRAIATRNGGFPLVNSAAFRQQLPGTGAIHHSGFAWLNTQGALAGLAGFFPNAPAIKSILEQRNPVLVVIDGESEQIRAASRTRLTSLLVDAMMFAGGQEVKALKGSPRAPVRQ